MVVEIRSRIIRRGQHVVVTLALVGQVIISETVSVNRIVNGAPRTGICYGRAMARDAGMITFGTLKMR